MQQITLKKRVLGLSGEQLAHRTLAGSGNALDHNDRRGQEALSATRGRTPSTKVSMAFANPSSSFELVTN
jgi:hypothetical protein